MFSSLSVNPDVGNGKRVCGKPIDSQKVNFSLGRPEWQQKYQSTSSEYHCKKQLTGNRAILTQEYLKPNYSNFELTHSPQKNPFLTSNARDYKKYNSKSNVFSEDEKEKIKFIRNSHIILGEHKPEKESIYGFIYRDPKFQKPRYDYNKINFRYNQYNLDPITQQPIWKDPNKMYPFDYFNRDKDKHFVIKRPGPFINTEYKKVWDPITNRYFYGTLKRSNTGF